MSTKALMQPARIAIAQRAHKCKANQKHNISQGQYRFEVKNERNWDKYCLACGDKIMLKLISDSSALMEDFKKYYTC